MSKYERTWADFQRCVFCGGLGKFKKNKRECTHCNGRGFLYKNRKMENGDTQELHAIDVVVMPKEVA